MGWKKRKKCCKKPHCGCKSSHKMGCSTHTHYKHYKHHHYYTLHHNHCKPKCKDSCDYGHMMNAYPNANAWHFDSQN